MSPRRQIVFVAGREPTYVRNSVILQALRDLNFDVAPCVSRRRSSLGRHFEAAVKWLRFRLTRRAIEATYVGFLGHLLVPLVRLTSRRPIYFDAFISVYDTLCWDRRLVAPDSLAGRALLATERAICRMATMVIVDTSAHAEYFVETLRVPRERVAVVPVGYDERMFSSLPDIEPTSRRVFYYSSDLPVHGLGVVLRAAELVRPHGVEFVIAGVRSSPAGTPSPSNVRFLGWVPYESIPRLIAESELCLGGHFSDRAKAARTVAGKTYQFAAMGRPVIVSDTPANLEVFAPDVEAFYCRPDSPEDLARAILHALANPRRARAVGAAGQRRVSEHAGREAVADAVASVLGGVRA